MLSLKDQILHRLATATFAIVDITLENTINPLVVKFPNPFLPTTVFPKRKYSQKPFFPQQRISKIYFSKKSISKRQFFQHSTGV